MKILKTKMLWRIIDLTNSIEEELESAIKYYIKKYSTPINQCFVNSKTYKKFQTNLILINNRQVNILIDDTVLNNHFLIGYAENS